jgi:hypothetical protein
VIINAFLEVLLPIIAVVGCGYALRWQLPIEVRSLNRVSMYSRPYVLARLVLADAFHQYQSGA